MTSNDHLHQLVSELNDACVKYEKQLERIRGRLKDLDDQASWPDHILHATTTIDRWSEWVKVQREIIRELVVLAAKEAP